MSIPWLDLHHLGVDGVLDRLGNPKLEELTLFVVLNIDGVLAVGTPSVGALGL